MAVKLTDDQKSFFNAKAFVHVATINKDGSPQISPMWVELEGDTIVLNSEQKRLKVRNLKRDGRVALSVQRLENPYNYVEIRGKVKEITTIGGFEGIDRLSLKYTGQAKYQGNQPGDVRVVIRIEPERVLQPMG